MEPFVIDWLERERERREQEDRRVPLHIHQPPPEWWEQEEQQRQKDDEPQRGVIVIDM